MRTKTRRTDARARERLESLGSFVDKYRPFTPVTEEEKKAYADRMIRIRMYYGHFGVPLEVVQLGLPPEFDPDFFSLHPDEGDGRAGIEDMLELPIRERHAQAEPRHDDEGGDTEADLLQRWINFWQGKT